ncbi:hypothetical protein ACWIFK_01920 [Streptomyces althioticus]|uniref:hypothetical protein n=1 Tax=Streptomyces sp. MAD19A TaxID=3242896 RepID=UPI0035297B3C
MSKDVERARLLLAAFDPADGVDRVPERTMTEIAAARGTTASEEGGTVREAVRSRRRGKRLWAGAVLVTAGAAAVVTALVVLPEDEPGGGGVLPEVTVAPQADDVLPSVTSTDWVTYADQVAVVRPTSDREIPASEEEKEAGEGYIGRQATLAVDKVLWSRPDAPQAPESLSLDVAGWVFKDGRRQEFAVHDTPRLEPGHTYILALARLDDGTWSILGSGAALPYDNGIIGNGESEGKDTRTPGKGSGDSVEEQVAGERAQALVTLLRKASPDPAAVPYADLPPEERYAKAAEAK